jgi:BirA family biotin operon repressor/biotin-[acetyl-CoA-carboxylase] ligase
MRTMTTMLFPQRIAALCRETAQRIAIEVVAETGSTNADLLSRINHLSSPVLLTAETQTAGRGRAGRTWLSAPGASLTFSLAWNFKCPLHELVGLPLAVGVVIAEVLAQFNIDARLKWPNDVLKDGKKLAGILIETASPKKTADNAIWAVIGIGLNIAIPDNLAAQIGRPVADAAELQPDRNALLAELLNGLAEALVLFEEQGFQAFMTRWNLLHAYAGQPVVILDHGTILHEGIAAGVDHIGRLLLDTTTGRTTVVAGDVSLRVRED